MVEFWPLPIKSSRPRGRCHQVAAATAPQKRGPSDVAPAPLKLLPDYAEERSIRQRGQRKRFPCPTDGDNRSAFYVDRSAAIERQVHWIIGMTSFDFDHRFIRDNY